MAVLDSDKARYIMIGGFLGAGKTTAVSALARRLGQQGRRVGLISNDQSVGLVDTNLFRSQGFTVEEITGGCFCCRFNSLVDASDKLTKATAPEVFIAEPVGSCTDLVATVTYPLRRIYGEQFVIAPLSVLVDPVRAGRVFGLIEGRPFSEKVAYIYKKQLEEAEIIVLNKCDSVDADLRDRLVDMLRLQFPRADVICCSAREGVGLDDWFSRLTSEECDATHATMDVDYEMYAEGEALLGWLNCTVRLSSATPFNADTLLLALGGSLRDRIDGEGGEIAHLKMTLDGGDLMGKLSVVSLVRSDSECELRESLPDEIVEGSLVLNLRAELAPELLRAMVEATLAELDGERGVHAEVEHLESFRPGKPEPTHRMADALESIPSGAAPGSGSCGCARK